jgi:RND family efflux transporter MFP subunit
VKDYKKKWTLPGILLAAIVFSPAARAVADDNALDCVMEPSDEVELSSPVQGILDAVNADRGDFVKKGQVVAKLQSGIEEASLRLAKARAVMDVDINARKAEYEMKKRTSGQFESLYDKKLASLHDYDDAKTQSIVAEHEYKKAIEVKHLAQLEQEHAQEVLNQRYLKSPINGVVIERMKSPGEFVEEQPVMKIAQIDPLNVEVIAPLALLGKIRVGMNAPVKAEQPVSETYQARVTIVDPVVHASSGTFGVRLALPNPERKIQAGLRCKVMFNIEPVAGGSQFEAAPSVKP